MLLKRIPLCEELRAPPGRCCRYPLPPNAPPHPPPTPGLIYSREFSSSTFPVRTLLISFLRSFFLALFLVAYSFGACLRGATPPKWSAPPEQTTQSWSLLPQSGTTRVGERVAHCPGGQMTDSSLGSSAQRAAWNRACARVRHSILLSLLPFRRKGALLPPISLQAHAFNSTKMFSTWRR